MKGLEQYIRKHGNHFTKELALKVTGDRWSSYDIERAAQKRVYYNVTKSTIGDMIYLADMVCNRPSQRVRLNKGIKEVLCWVQDYKRSGSPFCIWLTVIFVEKEDFDFTPYI